ARPPPGGRGACPRRPRARGPPPLQRKREPSPRSPITVAAGAGRPENFAGIAAISRKRATRASAVPNRAANGVPETGPPPLPRTIAENLAKTIGKTIARITD